MFRGQEKYYRQQLNAVEGELEGILHNLETPNLHLRGQPQIAEDTDADPQIYAKSPIRTFFQHWRKMEALKDEIREKLKKIEPDLEGNRLDGEVKLILDLVATEPEDLVDLAVADFAEVSGVALPEKVPQIPVSDDPEDAEDPEDPVQTVKNEPPAEELAKLVEEGEKRKKKWTNPAPSHQDFVNKVVTRIGSGIELAERCDTNDCYLIYDHFNRWPYRNQFSREFLYGSSQRSQSILLQIPPKDRQTEAFLDTSIWKFDARALPKSSEGHILGLLLAGNAKLTPKKSTEAEMLILGFGAGFYHHFFKDNFPMINTTTVEESDAIIDIAEEFFNVKTSKTGRNRLIHQQVMEFLEKSEKAAKAYNAIILNYPPAMALDTHLFSEKAVKLFEKLLADDGFLFIPELNKPQAQNMATRFATSLKCTSFPVSQPAPRGPSLTLACHRSNLPAKPNSSKQNALKQFLQKSQINF
ncbi:unnamed protein product, partial [Mesorhabditis spiculigera]